MNDVTAKRLDKAPTLDETISEIAWVTKVEAPSQITKAKPHLLPREVFSPQMTT